MQIHIYTGTATRLAARCKMKIMWGPLFKSKEFPESDNSRALNGAWSPLLETLCARVTGHEAGPVLSEETEARRSVSCTRSHSK